MTHTYNHKVVMGWVQKSEHYKIFLSISKCNVLKFKIFPSSSKYLRNCQKLHFACLWNVNNILRSDFCHDSIPRLILHPWLETVATTKGWAKSSKLFIFEWGKKITVLHVELLDITKIGFWKISLSSSFKHFFKS